MPPICGAKNNSPDRLALAMGSDAQKALMTFDKVTELSFRILVSGGNRSVTKSHERSRSEISRVGERYVRN